MVGALLALFLVPAQAGMIAIDRFCGLNDSDSPATISDCEAQDVLNVEANLNGTAAKKRPGFTREATLTISTGPVTGAHEFKCDSGDVLRIVCHDRYCSKSTNGGAFVTFLSTAGGAGAVPTRWSLVSVDGDIYGANDRRDAVFKYDCTNLTHPTDIPAVSILALTEDRLVGADDSSNPNRVHYSKSGAFTTFTVGSATEDPWSDDLGSPGDRTTGLAYNAGILWIFRSQSTLACELGDQYTTRCAIFSPNIGTNDPNSIVIANGSVFFRGNDKAYWQIGPGGSLNQVSKKIANFSKNQLSGASRVNTQTTQGDWEQGTESPADSWDTVTTAGSVFPSSFTFVDTSSTNFAAGTLTNTSTLSVTGSVTMIQAGSGTFVNAGGESGDSTNWTTQEFLDSALGDVYGSKNWSKCFDGTLTIQIRASDGTVLHSRSVARTDEMDEVVEIQTSTFPHTMIKLWLQDPGGGACASATAESVAFIRPEKVAIRLKDTSTPDSSVFVAWDIDEGIFLTTAATFTSRAINSALAAPVWGPISISLSSTTQGSATFETQVATSADGAWSTLASVDQGDRASQSALQYIRYRAALEVHGTTNTPAQLNEVSLTAATTGQFTTQCIQPGTGITAWGVLSCDFTTAGAGSLTIETSTGTDCADLSDSAFTSQTNNATITGETGAAFNIRLTSLLGSSTDQAQVNACTTYWDEGSPAQPVWGAFDSVSNAIYWTATTTSATQGDRVIKYDLNLDQWFPFDLRATALGYFANNLYFGSSTGGFWNKYGSAGVNTDNGSNINAYWKSKDFGGNDPFVEKDWQKLSIVARNNVTGNFTTTWTDSFNKSSNFTVSLATTTGINYIRSNHALLKRSPSNFMNVKFGNNSATPFEVLGLKVDFAEMPWRTGNP